MKKFARSLGAISVAVAFGAGSAALAPAAGAQSLPTGSLGSSAADVCGEQVVTPSSQESAGWFTPNDETPAVIGAVADAGEDIGAGALTFPDDTDAKKGTSLYKDANGIELAELLQDDAGDLLPISFDYFSEGQAPALQIRLNDANLHEDDSDQSGFEIGFATIVWSPADGEGAWATATPDDAKEFWITRKIDKGDGTASGHQEKFTLSELIALNPDAVVTEYGVQRTQDNAEENIAVDNFQLGCSTTNFELDPAGSLENIFGSVTGIFSS